MSKDPVYDCDFYYFKPGGKWKYEGEGFFPGSLHCTHEAIRLANNGMPGITGDGRHYTIAVIPRENCASPYGYPRLVLAVDE